MSFIFSSDIIAPVYVLCIFAERPIVEACEWRANVYEGVQMAV